MNDKITRNRIPWLLACSLILLLFNAYAALYSRVLHTFVFVYSPLGFIGCLLFGIFGVVKIFKKKMNGFPILLINLATITISITSILQTPPHYLTEKDLVVKGFYKSPDEQYVVVEYMNGSRDGVTRTSLIKLKDKDKQNLSEYELPKGYQYSKWTNVDSVEFIVYLTADEMKQNKNSDIFVNNIKVVTHQEEIGDHWLKQ